MALCKGNYDSEEEKVSVYCFPKDETEKQKWIDALPNIINRVTPHIGICSKHWPLDAPFIKIRRYLRPQHPPTIFPGCPTTMLRQTVPSSSRQVDERGISSSSRGERDEADAFEKQDRLPKNWNDFVDFISSHPIIAENDLTVVNKCGVLKLMHLQDNEIDYIITISQDFKLKAMRSNTPVNVRDLLGFQWELTRCSQLEAIICRTRLKELCHENEVSAFVNKMKHGNVAVNEHILHKHYFLMEQLELMNTPKNSRRYSSLVMKASMQLFLRSRNAYSCSRNILTLPHPDTIRSYFGCFGHVGSDNEARSTVTAVLSTLSGLQKHCCLLFDEIYINPSFRFRGGHIVGEAADNPQKPARTVLAVMLKPMMSSECFVIRLIPIFSLTGDFLFQQLCLALQIVQGCGGKVLAMVCDNATTNRKCYKKFRKGSESWLGFNPHDPSRDLHLLFDSVHLMKCVRNNWINEKCQQLKLELPTKTIVGKWSDIVDLYKNDSLNIARRTTLKRSSCFPSLLERQKVSLVFDVFNEKTVAALVMDGKSETAEVVDFFFRLWKFLNCKNPHLHLYLNDPDRSPFSSVLDARFQTMEVAVNVLQKMKCEEKIRIQSLTSSTRDAFVQTLTGLHRLGKRLLNDTACQYVMFGIFQTDPVESEFSAYRQLSGGNFYISVEEILSSAHLRRLELFDRLEIDHISCESENLCCTSAFTDDENLLFDSVAQKVESISLSEKSALFYISGYVAFKLKISRDPQMNEPPFTEESEFTTLVSRGKLQYPPESLFSFSLIAYAFFCSLDKPRCSNRIKRLLVYLGECYFFEIENFDSVCRRFSNCFLKGVVVRKAEIEAAVHHEKRTARRKRKFVTD